MGFSMMAAGSLMQGIGQYNQGKASKALAGAEAMYERDAAKQQAEMILKAAGRERGRARAATAASGTRLDEFSSIIEQDIMTRGETDAAMTILSGERKGRALEHQGKFAEIAGRQGLANSMFDAAGYGLMKTGGWKGAREPAVVDDGYSVGQGSAYGGSRRGM